MRVSYASASTNNLSTGEKDILEAVKSRRGAAGLLPLDYALLHSYPIAKGWHQLFSAIRTETNLSPDILQLAICRVALHCGAQIPWKAYLANLTELDGMTNEKLEVVETRDPSSQGALSDLQWVVLRYADAMTTRVVIEEALFREIQRSGLDERQIVELTATIAAYNFVSRFLVALDVDERQ
jgi:alkylhydroperoxidase family enzyme